MMMTERVEMIVVVCACCSESFWDWEDSTDTLCDFCTNYEPLEFDDWE